MKIPVHYFPGFLCKVFIKHESLFKCRNFHPTADGWTTVVKCNFTNIEYRVDVTPIKSEKIVIPDTYQQLLQQDGI
jgi:hypothetical protein